MKTPYHLIWYLMVLMHYYSSVPYTLLCKILHIKGLCSDITKLFTFTIPYKLMNRQFYSLHVYVTLKHTIYDSYCQKQSYRSWPIPAPCPCQNAAHTLRQNTVFPAKLQTENYKKSCIQGTLQESYLHISIMTTVYFTQLTQTYLNGKVVPTHAMEAYSRSLAPINLSLGTR